MSRLGVSYMPFPVDVSLIQAAERLLGRKLPPDLRVRLHRLNGGEIQAIGDSWNLFPVCDPAGRRRIARTANHIIRETKAAREGAAGFPQDAIAIAENGGGDYLIVRGYGNVIEFWDHETGETEPVEVDWM